MRISDWSSDVCSSDLVGGHEQADTAMFNIWYELLLSSSLRPYIGGGAGAARVAFHGARYDSNEMNDRFETLFAWQAGAGFAFHFTKQVTASLDRSEEHTSELQSLMRSSYAVFCLKKKIHIQ